MAEQKPGRSGRAGILSRLTKRSPTTAVTAAETVAAPAKRAVPAAVKKPTPAKPAAAKATPAKKAATAAPAKATKPVSAKAAAKAAPTKVTPAKKTTPAKAGLIKAAPAKAAPAKAGPAKTTKAPAPVKPAPAAKAPVKPTPAKTTKAPAAKAAPAKPAKRAAPARSAGGGLLPTLPGDRPWTSAEVAEIRRVLQAEADDLRNEIEEASTAYDRGLFDNDPGPGDEADAGTVTFEREHNLSIAANSRDLLAQVERAVDRLEAGTYGICEVCGQPIGKERLKAFPKVTLCVSCKQRENRR